MRRSTTAFVLLALVAAACTGDGSSGSGTTTTADSADSGTTGDESAESSGSATTTTAAAATTTTEPARYRPEPTPLPGLLDTTSGELENDDEVITGTLDNGLTFYVRENGSPLGRTTLRLAIRAGSVDELGDSTGVAHFVEHMLFNGTEAYPENDLIDVLQGFGADFGPHINAYTSFDETVYMLTVPSERTAVTTALDVMKEWLSFATFADDAVDGERGVMADEWRIRNESLGGRQSDHTFRMFLGDTPYGTRWVGGDAESIDNVPTTELREFYDTYYRPDNAAIVIVGDIDARAAVGWLTDAFGSTPTPTDALPDFVDFAFDLDTESQVGVYLDPDEDTAAIEVTLPLPAFDGSPLEQLRVAVLDDLIQRILVRRLEDDLYDGIAPFDQVWDTDNDWVEQLDATALYVEADPAEAADALDAVLLELRRAFEHGFHDAEVETAAAGLTAEVELEFAGRATVRDEQWAEDLVANFLTGAPYPNLTTFYPAAITEVDGADAAALHERFKARYSNSAPHVLLFAPDGAADLVPTEHDVLAAIIAASHAETRQRPEPEALPDELMTPPDPIAAVDETTVDARGDTRYGYTEFTYPNGVRLRVIENDQNAGLVVISAASIGGVARVPDDDVIDANYAGEIALASGVGPFNQAEVDTILADDSFEVWAWSEFYFDRLYGETTAAELDDTFQYIHLLMAEPRFDQVAIDQTIAGSQALVDDPSIDPDTARYDLLAELRYGNDPRFTTIPTPQQFATLDREGAHRIWSDRFGDASDWLFVVYGDLTIDEAARLGELYLATLPAGDGEDEPLVDPPAPITGISEAVIEAGQGRTAATTFYFTTPIETVTGQLRAEADLVAQIVSSRLTEVVREEFGESYSPWASVWFTNEPTPFLEANIDVTASPDGVERVTRLVLAELDDLAANGPAPDELERARAVVGEQYGWKGPYDISLDLLLADLFAEVTLDDYVLTVPREFDDWPIDAGDVRRFVAAYLPTDRYVHASSVPR